MGKIEERPGKVSFGQAWRDYFVGYVDFKGRSTRAGYWWVNGLMLIFAIIASIVVMVPFIGIVIANQNETPDVIFSRAIVALLVPLLILLIISLAFILPSVTLTVRRMRDVGIRGRGQLIIILIFIILSILFTPSIPVEYYDDSIVEIIKAGAVRNIWTAGVFILSVLPTGTLATNAESGILAFFFKHKRFYEDIEL